VQLRSSIIWILVGFAAASLVEPLLEGDGVGGLLSPYLQVPIFAFLGLPFRVGSSTLIPAASIFMRQGISPGAAIAFLLTGPTMMVKEIIPLVTPKQSQFAMTFPVMISATISIVIGYLINGILQDGEGVFFQHHPLTGFSTVHIASLVILGFVLLISMLRHGPRRLFQR
jgi:uncharacterized membrane protein YraQ (UPF0718 family)